MRFPVVRPVYGLVGTLWFGIFLLILPVVMFYNGFILVGSIFLILWLFNFFFGVVHHCFLRSIVFSSEGVKYITLFKTLKLKWDEIKVVGIGYVPIKKLCTKPWIYFSADEVAIEAIPYNMINDRFFMMQYRKEIIKIIKQYWPHDIAGINNIR